MNQANNNPAEAALAATHAAARAGDAEATDRHWREFVRLCWLPMAASVPWDRPAPVERLP